MSLVDLSTWVSNDPERYVQFLLEMPSQRKLLLLGVAIARMHSHLLEDPRFETFLQAVEQIADGTPFEDSSVQSRLTGLQVAYRATARDVLENGPNIPPVMSFRKRVKLEAAAQTRSKAIVQAAQAHLGVGALLRVLERSSSLTRHHSVLLTKIVQRAIVAAKRLGRSQGKNGNLASAEARDDLLRLHHDILGKDPLPSFDPRWLEWERGTVLRVAETIYVENRFEEMPILADALEEAGCKDYTILDHCRGRGPHGKGCWLLDELLGKD